MTREPSVGQNAPRVGNSSRVRPVCFKQSLLDRPSFGAFVRLAPSLVFRHGTSYHCSACVPLNVGIPATARAMRHVQKNSLPFLFTRHTNLQPCCRALSTLVPHPLIRPMTVDHMAPASPKRRSFSVSDQISARSRTFLATKSSKFMADENIAWQWLQKRHTS